MNVIIRDEETLESLESRLNDIERARRHIINAIADRSLSGAAEVCDLVSLDYDKRYIAMVRRILCGASLSEVSGYLNISSGVLENIFREIITVVMLYAKGVSPYSALDSTAYYSMRDFRRSRHYFLLWLSRYEIELIRKKHGAMAVICEQFDERADDTMISMPARLALEASIMLRRLSSGRPENICAESSAISSALVDAVRASVMPVKKKMR